MVLLSTEPLGRTLGPDELKFREHVEGGGFRAGELAGRWRLLSLEWPRALVAVSAAERPGSPGEFVLRLTLTGYPASGPTAAPWDVEHDTVLASALRPKGGRASTVFRTNWERGEHLYAPWDGFALSRHQNWLSEAPELCWNSGRDIAFFLARVHDVLNAPDYVGV